MRTQLFTRYALVSVSVISTGAFACADEETSDHGSTETIDLDWDTSEVLDSDLPACPADQLDCDRLDEPDTPEADADAGNDDPGAVADPKAAGKFRIWPAGRIPYRFMKNTNGTYQLNAATRTRLSQAMTNWERLTEGRIKFRGRRAEKAYVNIGLGASAVSPFVGYHAGQVQTLRLRQNEPITVMKHELGHVVGFQHEQRRSDRLNYIQVRTGNIVNSTLCRYQFSVCSNCSKVGPYDISSIMHYRTSDLGNCRTGPVLLKKSGAAISHTWQLSTRDRNAVAAVYAANALVAEADATDLPETGSIIAGNRCIDLAGGATAEGARVVATDCQGASSQDWRATSSGQLRVKHSLRCTAVVGDSAPNAAVEQAACASEAPQQKWLFEDMELVNGSTGKCIDAGLGSQLGFTACTGAATQKLAYHAEREAIVARGLCATVAADSSIVLRTCDDSPGQHWFQGRGGFVSRANTGQCMQVAVNGAALEVADCIDEPSQRWALRGALRDARARLCLQIGDSSELALARCDGSTAQSWTFWSR